MTTLPLSNLMHTLAEELRSLAVTAEEMHHLVCHEHLSRDSDYVRAVQRIDHTTQLLDNLSTFVAAIGEQTAEGWDVTIGPALNTVRLEELRRRLHTEASETFATGDDGGDLELFG
ncbi:hypothetical protein E3C22_11095 [Jiella endophytica]|uniref:Uncharacterized protein n=1 Tax=Jiella endophytica TaxID=2558362 RepID=A0A4Y8RJM8_9HYPH|nr:hypothetical protein [Jiella endophytica]TFF22987.1 hypothetical protein E3C22_11095 [Jiella endophytica]